MLFFLLLGIIAGLAGLSLSGTSVYSLLPTAFSELFGKDNVQTVMAINFVYQGVSQIVATFAGGKACHRKLPLQTISVIKLVESLQLIKQI